MTRLWTFVFGWNKPVKAWHSAITTVGSKPNKNIKKDVELSKGMQLIAQCKGQRFTMTRWDRSRGATVDNMLFLTEDMAKLHEEATLKTGTVPQADGG